MNSDLEIIKNMESRTGMKYSDEQLKILQHRGGMCILACAGSGKALKNGTRVLTPNGYIPIEQLKVRDICYDENGKEQIIEGVFPQGKKEVYRVTFSDKSEIECCNEHLWTYKYIGKHGSGDWETNNLEHIMKNVMPLLHDGKGEIRIPVTKPIQFSKKDLPIDPYLVGAILASSAIEENCTSRVIGKLLASTDKYSFNSAIIELNKIGKLEKYIPSVYLYSDIDDRLELLRGLIDVAGQFKRGYYRISIMSEKLAYDIKELAETLGMIVRISENTVYDDGYGAVVEYKLDIRTCQEIPTIHSSIEGEVKIKFEDYATRTIKDITKTGSYANMTCIKVSGKSGLFLTENCIVTHNTTVLTHLLAKRILSGDISDTKRLLCTTFSKAGSTEMGERLDTLFGKLGINQRVQVSTMHASYYKVLKHFGLIGNVCTNAQRLKMVTDACRAARIRNISNEDIQLIDSLLSYQVNNLLSDENLIKSYVYTLHDVRPEQYSAVRYGYNKMKEELGLIDFDDMQLYMYMLLVVQQKEEVISFCRNLWNYFFIDEFQDTSKIQFAILRQLVTDHNKLIVIGDDDQCIYQWRGADPNIILDICGYYDIQKFVLSTNYRCGAEIVKRAAKGIKNNVRRSEKEMVPYNGGGVIKLCNVGNTDLYEMSKYAYKYIKSLIDNGVNPSDIAVLSRNNLHVSLLNNMLFKSGIYCITVPEMRMTNTNIYKDMKSIIKLSEPTHNANIVASTMWKVCPYLGANNSKAIAELVRDGGLNIKDALGYIITNYTPYDDKIEWMKSVKIPPKVDNKIGVTFLGCSDDVFKGIVRVYLALDLRDRRERIENLSMLYIEAMEFINRSKDRNRTVAGYFKYLTVILSEGVEETEAFLRLTEQYESGKMAIMGPQVNMATIHGAKGKEWEHVIIFADDNVTFPSFEGINKMILDKVGNQDISGSIDENRRLHYVAMTRAKKYLTIFADERNLSVYTLEALGLLDKGDYTMNKHIISMAVDGGIPVWLEEASRNLFSPESEYYLEIK